MISSFGLLGLLQSFPAPHHRRLAVNLLFNPADPLLGVHPVAGEVAVGVVALGSPAPVCELVGDVVVGARHRRWKLQPS